MRAELARPDDDAEMYVTLGIHIIQDHSSYYFYVGRIMQNGPGRHILSIFSSIAFLPTSFSK